MSKKRILVITPIPTHPRNAGHRERIYQIIRQLQDFGHEVQVLHVTLEQGGDLAMMQQYWGDRFHLFRHELARTPNRCSPSRHGTVVGKIVRNTLFRLGKDYIFPYAADDWYDHDLDQAVAELHQMYRFEVVLLEYLFLSKALACFAPDVLKIIDAIDIFTDRHRRYKQHGQPPVWFSTTRRQERYALRRADVILAIQDHERRFFQRLTPEKQVVTIGHFVNLCPLPFKTGHPPTLLFLASANQANIHGLQWFLQQVWPPLNTQKPELRLLLAGSICPEIADHPALQKLGSFDAPQPIYAQADVVISPILFGTGLKIKNVEALGYAKPLVTTLSGAEGLEQGLQTAFFAAAAPEEFAVRIIELLTNSELRVLTCQQAYHFAERLHQQNLLRLNQLLRFN